MTDTELMDGFDDLVQRLYCSKDLTTTEMAQEQAEQLQDDVSQNGLTGRQALEKLLEPI
jgi:hypothetical protein